MKQKKIKTLSLFSGAGGLDIGFHLSGFDIVACVELEEKYCNTLIKNRENKLHFGKMTTIHNIDIRDFDVTPYKDLGIECIIGGPPCQTFSAAGRRAGGVIGTDDARGQLYEVYCEILDELRPEVFVFENVYGLPGANGGEPWREIQKAFTEHGYDLTAEVVDAADYGVPQHRERLIMIGTRQKDYVFPIPIVGPDSNTPKPLVSVNDAIKDLQKRNERYSDGLGGLYGHLLPDVPEGLNYAFFTAEMGHPEPVFAWRSKFHDLLYKVDRNQPCRTIKANPGKFTGPLHWKNRNFTIEELKRLQTFPDNYEIVGSYSHVVEQIGNSVPPKLAYVIAESIKEQILRPRKSLKYPKRPDDFVSTFRKRQRERSTKFKLIAQKAIKKKYGEVKDYPDIVSIKPKTVNFYSSYLDKFNRETFKRKPTKTNNYFKCSLTESGRYLRLDLDNNDIVSDIDIELEIVIKGLNKYLPKFDSFKLSGNLLNIETIFNCWKEIECILTDRSNFFTLIDIYGHYANRGDVVEIITKIKYTSNLKLIDLIEYFSQTDTCGSFVSEKYLMNLFGISRDRLYKIIEQMRELRYDIRTYNTHPIIGKNNILCTYPFPLLSPKALVISKVKLNKEKVNERQVRTA